MTDLDTLAAAIAHPDQPSLPWLPASCTACSDVALTAARLIAAGWRQSAPADGAPSRLCGAISHGRYCYFRDAHTGPHTYAIVDA
jgi:hypothetical protein